MLTENKFSKYSIYAIGEIILVVIGILLAIQLNEWRNDKSNAKQKQRVSLALKSEFESNLKGLDEVLHYQEMTLNAVEKTKNLIDSINYITNNEVFIDALTGFRAEWSYSPTNGALRSAVSSGDIHLIESDRLIELLFSWEDLVKDSIEESQRLINYGIDSYPLLDKYTQLREVWKEFLPNDTGSRYPSDFISLFKNPLFENYTQHMGFNTFNYMVELKIIRKSNLEIIELIDQELNQ